MHVNLFGSLTNMFQEIGQALDIGAKLSGNAHSREDSEDKVYQVKKKKY